MQHLSQITENLMRKAPMKESGNLSPEFTPKSLESILENRAINWREAPYSNAPLPIPVLEKDSKIFREVQDAIEKAAFSPATAKDYSGMLMKLQGHYWVQGMPEAVMRSTVGDYIRLLVPKNYPLQALLMAYDAFLLNPQNRFFPKIGELDTLICEQSYRVKWKAFQLEKLLERAV